MTASTQFLANPLGVTLGPEAIALRLSQETGWEERYKSVLALEREIPEIDSADQVEANLLHGCQAKVWVIHYFDEASGRLYFLCDSDSRIVKGLLACLLSHFNHKSPAQILDIDVRPWLREVGLLSHLVSSRSNGLWAMIGKMKAVASRY